MKKFKLYKLHFAILNWCFRHDGIKIGKWCPVGAGAVIINDVPDYSVVVGVPGRIIKSVNT